MCRATECLGAHPALRAVVGQSPILIFWLSQASPGPEDVHATGGISQSEAVTALHGVGGRTDIWSHAENQSCGRVAWRRKRAGCAHDGSSSPGEACPWTPPGVAPGLGRPCQRFRRRETVRCRPAGGGSDSTLLLHGSDGPTDTRKLRWPTTAACAQPRGDLVPSHATAQRMRRPTVSEGMMARAAGWSPRLRGWAPRKALQREDDLGRRMLWNRRPAHVGCYYGRCPKAGDSLSGGKCRAHQRTVIHSLVSGNRTEHLELVYHLIEPHLATPCPVKYTENRTKCVCCVSATQQNCENERGKRRASVTVRRHARHAQAAAGQANLGESRSGILSPVRLRGVSGA